MRILYVSHTHPAKDAILDNEGGMQRVSYQLINELQKRTDVTLHTETINVAGRGGVALQTVQFLLKMLFTLPRKVKQFEVDVILFSSMVTASLAPFLKKRVKIPFVTINHGRDVTLPGRIYQRFVPHIFAALDGVISVSEATRQQCIARGMKPERGAALPNGIDVNEIKYPGKSEARSLLEQEFGIPLFNKKMLLTVGRMMERKGHKWFIEQVLPDIHPDFVYAIIGDGPEMETVKNAAKNSPGSDKIFILGRQPDTVLHRAYAAADLFIMPNIPVEGDMEGFGIVLLEANLAGTPAIASDLEGIKDVITNGENGFRVPALNSQKFAEMVNDVLKSDLNLLSQKSRTHVQHQFGWPEVAMRYFNFLKQVINHNTDKT